jgi:hypothetical protein
MSRQEVYRVIKGKLGRVPAFFDLVPDPSLESEWRLFFRRLKGRD